MKLRQPCLGHAILLCFSVATILACVTTPTHGVAPVPVVAAVPPLGWLAEQVGGDRVAVRVLISPGRDPHHFEPTPGDVRGLGEARLALRVGHPAFGFEERLLAPLSRRSAPIATVSLAEVAQKAGASLGGDPHLWLSPPVLVEAAGRLAEVLAELDPQGAARYRQRGAALQEELRALDERLLERLAASPCRTFLVDHPAWGSFAERYGLTQLALEIDGKEPGPASLVRLMGEAESAGIRKLLVLPGKPSGSTRTISRTLGADVETLDPLAPEVPATLERLADLVARSCDHD
jgi:zinc transport system substrate-binding protein